MPCASRVFSWARVADGPSRAVERARPASRPGRRYLCGGLCVTCTGRSSGVAGCTRVSVFVRLYVLRVYKTPQDRPGK